MTEIILATAKKDGILAIIGAIGGFLSQLLGGWTPNLTTLLILMCVDYITGIIVAGILKKSTKTANGALSSRVGLIGISKKGVMLLIVLVAYRVDLTIGGTSYIRDAVIIALIVNELLSLTENASLMGVPIPKKLARAIDIIKSKSEEDD